MPSRRREIADQRRNKRDNKTSDGISPESIEFLQVGILRRPHGVKGEMLMAVMTDFPERIKAGVILYLGNDYQPYEVKHTRHHNKGFIIQFVETEDRESVDSWRNVTAYVKSADRPPLPDGEYYQHQLLGLTVITDQGVVLGPLVDFIETGANSVYVVRDAENKELLIPSIAEVVLNVDLEKREILVHLLDGLLESNL